MKKQILNVLILAVLFCFAGSAYGQKTAEIKEEKIKVGFHCPNGKALLESDLKKVDGVTGVVADLETKIVTITFVEGKSDRKKLVEAIEKTGYTTEDTKPGTPIKKACSHDMPQDK